jgi:hypothetical protein
MQSLALIGGLASMSRDYLDIRSAAVTAERKIDFTFARMHYVRAFNFKK